MHHASASGRRMVGAEDDSIACTGRPSLAPYQRTQTRYRWIQGALPFVPIPAASILRYHTLANSLPSPSSPSLGLKWRCELQSRKRSMGSR
ncbi:hypothetical protein AB1N83_004035 [Pleurotus pulmonarius]